MIKIDKRAAVDPKAELGENVQVGPFTIIEENVRIGENSLIAPGVHIASGTRIGKNVRIFTGAVLGTIPQDLKFGGEETILEIGDETTIREHATLNRGTHESRVTRIGKNCLIMAYAHVAHDCHIGENVILANAVNLAGHVTIEDWAAIGGMVPVHQFIRIGMHSFIGGGYRVAKDVPPYVRVMGEPLQFGGINLIGLKRRGFSQAQLSRIKKAYRIIYQMKLNVSQAIKRIKAEMDLTDEVKKIVEFIEQSERGIVR
ncbi:acyl-[acyl-carrier-protein]--UDP-N-acetylglucosamine O-acyltransferase [bacterium BMS3Abin05]|nr:acyl-[acyl-carrier-protein]--UDP-N-acetylglucosamine O-acyltransferase [bacterium BMS3Abin05]GBE27411.1 acyl-[acyl-carrier-protein]--UDP-N-acetylglucosamine O-acyltransferase [bacterium BMS3Bbin03]HDZ12382.1 acyl-ACP--UDP-N-acetylglucosamine O-acyltransferase [Bacteroidota bacterium]